MKCWKNREISWENHVRFIHTRHMTSFIVFASHERLILIFIRKLSGNDKGHTHNNTIINYIVFRNLDFSLKGNWLLILCKMYQQVVTTGVSCLNLFILTSAIKKWYDTKNFKYFKQIPWKLKCLDKGSVHFMEWNSHPCVSLWRATSHTNPSI